MHVAVFYHGPRAKFTKLGDDILQAVDNGDLAALVLLDMSAAFGTVDHSILLRRLHLTFGIDDTAHGWFQSYVVSLLQEAVRTPRPVHRRSADGDRKLRIITTHVRRRHTGVRFVLSTTSVSILTVT